MDDPVKYTIEFEPKDLALIGELLDAQPHGKVAKLVAAMQVQISAQDAAEKTRSAASWEATRKSWVDGEIERRSAAAQADLPKSSGRSKKEK